MGGWRLRGKRTYYNSFVTDLDANAGDVAELAACGRVRWNACPCEGRDRERNVQRPQNQRIQPRAQLWARQGDTGSVLVALNLLAFGFHTAAMLAVLAWRQAVIARGATYRTFEHLRTITAFVLDQDRDHLLRSITAAATRPP